MRLLEPTSGSVDLRRAGHLALSQDKMRPVRREMMMVFQDPYASLNPRKRVGFIVGEALEVHKMGTEAENKRRVQELLEVVGLNPEHYNRFPHEFSGGQRQRIGIARALAVNPKLIVGDEPVSALDVSVQAQILNLLKDLQAEFGLTYVFIAHDLHVVRHISDRVAVMYLGKVAELADASDLYERPKHPVHGRAALGRPDREPACRAPAQAVVLEGDVPNPINPPSGCRFHPRCPRAQDRCARSRSATRRSWPGNHLQRAVPARALALDRPRRWRPSTSRESTACGRSSGAAGKRLSQRRDQGRREAAPRGIRYRRRCDDRPLRADRARDGRLGATLGLRGLYARGIVA